MSEKISEAELKELASQYIDIQERGAKAAAIGQGYDAGYADAVADIRQMVASERDEDQEALSWVIRRLDIGAHIGAANKGGGR